MKKTLVLSLGRTGILHIYAEKMISNFKDIDYDVIISRDRILKNKVKNAIEISTYKDKKSFILNTLLFFPIKFLSLIPQLYKNYDILYLPYQHLWDIPFILLFKLLGRKVVFTVHDGVLHTGERNFIMQFLTNYRMRHSNCLIYLTQYVKRLVEERYKIIKPSHIVPLPIIENDFINIKKRNRDSKNLLFLGRIDKYKGVEMLMDSVFDIPNEFDRLIIAGKSLYTIDYLKHEKIEIKDKYLSEEEIGALLSWANVLILPYTEATQSAVITLGVYAELPMICTKVGGFSEQLAEDESFWCEPNKEDLALTIKEVFKNPEKYNNIKNKLTEKKNDLSWSVIAKQIEHILLS
ncbi:glycosyltransferase family 4 protein [Mariniflexile aquimaris]|uniref:Glycosyltransferase family 4 protein n=1 Tax=Mariniflexile aquimaris TaxID=881009 RepID=A0ABW3BP31_9FLAO